MSVTHETGHVYALLADGTTVEIRLARPDDFTAVKAMHEALSADNTYLRFFNLSPLAAEQEARRTCRQPGSDHGALLALSAGEVVGCASFYATGEPGEPAKETPGKEAQPRGRTAEIAFAVADQMHHRGIATLLLEHLVSLAASRQITTFTAQTLTQNKAMQNVFASAGLPAHFGTAGSLSSGSLTWTDGSSTTPRSSRASRRPCSAAEPIPSVSPVTAPP